MFLTFYNQNCCNLKKSNLFLNLILSHLHSFCFLIVLSFSNGEIVPLICELHKMESPSKKGIKSYNNISAVCVYMLRWVQTRKCKEERKFNIEILQQNYNQFKIFLYYQGLLLFIHSTWHNL